MQTHGGQQAADAIEARERYFVERVLVDWGNDGKFEHPLSDLTPYVDEIDIDGSLASSLPPELLLIEGASATRMDLMLSGHYDDLPLSAQFAPYNGRSVFYGHGITLGVTVTYDIGVVATDGIVWYRQFTGVVHKPTPDRGSNQVHVSCLDNVEKMRGIAPISAASTYVGWIQDGFRAGGMMNAASVIDLAARSNGFATGMLAKPKFPGDARTALSVPFHGSHIPEVGSCDNIQTIPRTETWREQYPEYAEPWAPGGPLPNDFLHLNALPPAEHDNPPQQWPESRARWDRAYWVRETHEDGTAGWGSAYRAMGISAWVYFKGPGEAVDTKLVDLHSEGLGFTIDIRDSDGMVLPGYYHGEHYYDDQVIIHGPGLPMSPGWNYVECQYVNQDNADNPPGEGIWLRCIIGIDASKDTGWQRIADHDTGVFGDEFSGLVRIIPFYAMSDFAVISIYAANEAHYLDRDRTVLANSKISAGANKLAYTFNQRDKDGWTIIKEVAKAEFGVVRFDEEGTFIFETQQDVLDRQDTVVRDFTLDDLSGLQMQVTLDSVRNSWDVTTVDGAFDRVTCYDYSSDGPMLTAAGGKDDASSEPPFTPSDMVLAADATTYLYALGKENLIAPSPGDQGDLAESTEWDANIPVHGKINYFADDGSWGGAGAYDDGSHPTKQKWMGNGYWKISIHNGYTDQGVKFVDANGRKYFRVEGTLIQKEDATKWVVENSSSIAMYGNRSITLSPNFWYQDYDSINDLVTKLIDKFATPIPVTDAIAVPGDPRVQLGDTIAGHDPYGMGETIRLQVLGIRRRRRSDGGLADTYSVEVIRPPRHWVLGSPAYSILGRSTVLTETASRLNVNPGFTEGLDGWIGEAATLAIAADTGEDGGPVCAMTPDGSENWPYLYPSLSGLVPVVAGMKYSFDASVKLLNRLHAVGIQILWLDKNYAQISYEQYVTDDVPVDAWWYVFMHGATAPEGALYLKPRCYLAGASTPEDVMYIDHMYVTAG